MISSDAGALLLGATDKAIGPVDRFAGCFRDCRRPEFIEHRMETLVGQRPIGGLRMVERAKPTTSPRCTTRWKPAVSSCPRRPTTRRPSWLNRCNLAVVSVHRFRRSYTRLCENPALLETLRTALLTWPMNRGRHAARTLAAVFSENRISTLQLNGRVFTQLHTKADLAPIAIDDAVSVTDYVR